MYHIEDKEDTFAIVEDITKRTICHTVIKENADMIIAAFKKCDTIASFVLQLQEVLSCVMCSDSDKVAGALAILANNKKK